MNVADHITDKAVTVDSLIDLHARKLALIYANRTVGDHTFTGALVEFLAAALPVLDTTKDTEIAALRAALDAVAAEHEHTYLDVHYRQCAENVAAYARCDTCGNLPNGTLHCPTLAAASLRGEQ